MDPTPTITPDVTPAASSPAPSAPAPLTDLASLSKADYDHWNRHGTLPKATPADSPPAPAADAAPAIETPADSPPAEKTPRKKDVKTRTAELDTDIAGLQERLKLRRALRDELAIVDHPATAPRASDPAPKTTVADWQRLSALPDAPKVDAFDRYEDYTAAMSVFVADTRYEERQAQQQQTERAQAHAAHLATIGQQAQERIAAYAAAHPAFAETLQPELLEIPTVSQLPPGQPVRPWNVLAEEIANSPQVAELLEHFSSTEGAKEFRELCALKPAELLRAFGRLEARLEREAAPVTAAKPPKPVTSAPDPPLALGRRNADATDPAKAAVMAGDFAAFERAEVAKKLAAHR